jgi:acetylglutamate kinase
MANQLAIPTQMIEGRRITDASMLDVVTMVYGGLINKKIVAGLQMRGCNALGLTGADAQTITAIKRPIKTIDYGFVGDIVDVNVPTIYQFLHAGITPIFAPLTADKQGNILNTNADTQASAIATALSTKLPTSLYYSFEKAGVLRDAQDDNSVIQEINPSLYAELKEKKIITDGMIPKLDNAFEAIQKGVKHVWIGQASSLLPFMNGQKSGTLLSI